MPAAQPALPWARHRDLPSLDHAALLLIDFQQAFVLSSCRTFLPGSTQALSNARALTHAFRANGLPIFASRHAHRSPPRPGGMGSWWKSFLMIGDPIADLSPDLPIARHDVVIEKQTYSAFIDTPLHHELVNRKISTLVLAGVMTHVCVDTTARHGFCLGFDIIVVHDACASRSDDLHLASLSTLSHAVARVAASQEIIDRLDSPEGS